MTQDFLEAVRIYEAVRESAMVFNCTVEELLELATGILITEEQADNVLVYMEATKKVNNWLN